jgi:DNA-directed RNA polymerase specialized sigma subunit
MNFLKILLILYNSGVYINNLTSKNIGIVHYFVKPYIQKNPRLTYDQKKDLYQEGYLGMCYAARKFNESKGYKFTTYSSFWIRRYLQLELNRINKYNQLIPLIDNLAKIKLYDKLDLRFLSDYEFDILTSFYVKGERQYSIANRYNIKIHRLQKDIKFAILKIRKEYLYNYDKL